MDPSDDLDDFLERIQPMTPEEQQEILLGYFTQILAGMTAGEVLALRAHFLKRFPPSLVQDTMLEVMDGHVALRKLT